MIHYAFLFFYIEQMTIMKFYFRHDKSSIFDGFTCNILKLKWLAGTR